MKKPHPARILNLELHPWDYVKSLLFTVRGPSIACLPGPGSTLQHSTSDVRITQLAWLCPLSSLPLTCLLLPAAASSMELPCHILQGTCSNSPCEVLGGCGVGAPCGKPPWAEGTLSSAVNDVLARVCPCSSCPFSSRKAERRLGFQWPVSRWVGRVAGGHLPHTNYFCSLTLYIFKK